MAAGYFPQTSFTSTSAWTSTSTVTSASTAATTDIYDWTTTPAHQQVVIDEVVHEIRDIFKAFAGSKIELPDGCVLHVGSQGFSVNDSKGKVSYKKNSVLEFNKYINASDQLEDFIRDVGKLGVKQSELLDLPVELFIHWLITRASEQDNENDINVTSLEDLTKKYKHPRCKCCGRFIESSKAAKGLLFCNGEHYQRFLEKVA